MRYVRVRWLVNEDHGRLLRLDGHLFEFYGRLFRLDGRLFKNQASQIPAKFDQGGWIICRFSREKRRLRITIPSFYALLRTSSELVRNLNPQHPVRYFFE